MPQTCRKCSRINPDDAAYCYYDGNVLGGSPGANGGPIKTGSQPFHNQFVFPSGLTCRNFDQLALAFQDNWESSVNLLKQGYLETFLGGLGRADLALTAREAAKFPDQERGLDQLLAKLPTDVVKLPKLHVEPREINFGQMQVGEDRLIEVHLANQGMRLLYGSITCDDCVWLGVGEAPGAPQKLFQLSSDAVVPLHVRGKHLRASPKPIEGKLVVESNGGSVVITVRAEVLVKPYPNGILAGASSPRELAEKAKASPKDAATYFENGSVSQWYRDNGWTFPVQGPPASGLGAIQQFFEALGLTPAPRVEVREKFVRFQGKAGDSLHHMLEVSSPEKRPVYAYGISNQGWLEIGRARLEGRLAALPLVIPAVPRREGETLQAKVTVVANGNQRFVIPVTLEVAFAFDFNSEPAAVAPLEAPAPAALEVTPIVQKPPAEPVPLPAPVTQIKPAKKKSLPFTLPKTWVHAVPAVLLVLALVGLVVVDAFVPARISGFPVKDKDATELEVADKDPRIAIRFNEQKLRFGIILRKENDPSNPGKPKRLTYDESGSSNNTCIKIDDNERLFGLPPGRWFRDGRLTWHLIEQKKNMKWRSVWEYPDEKVRVAQEVEIVPGEQSRLYDTCLVHYTLENADSAPHTVGLRVMLDTFIGANDGVPFQIPGDSQLLESLKKFDAKEIPSFIRAQENADPQKPGTVAVMGLKLHDFEPLDKMLICHWPGSEVRWEWNPTPMNQPPNEKDSCMALYWSYRKMDPGEKRELGFTYGMGTVEGTSGRLGLSVHGATRPGGVFTVTAFVREPAPGQKVRIVLPMGLTLESGENQEKAVAAVEKGKDSQVSWKVKADKVGDYEVQISSDPAVERKTVKVNEKSIFE